MSRLLGTARKPSLVNVDDVAAVQLAEELASNTTVTEIDLINQTVSDVGAKALAASLIQNTTLVSLDLSQNLIGSAGARALLVALDENKTLAALDLSGNEEVDAGLLGAIANKLENNTMGEQPRSRPDKVLHLPTIGIPQVAQSLFSTSRPRLLPPGTNEATLKDLDSEGIVMVSEELVMGVELTFVSSLTLKSCVFTTAAAQALAKALWAPGLSSLSLIDVSISANAFSHIAASLEKHAPLRALRIQNPRGALLEDKHGAEPLACAIQENSKLQSLILDTCAIDATGASVLAKGLSANVGLTLLSLANCVSLRASGLHTLIDALGVHPSLEVLDLTSISLGDEGAVALGHLIAKQAEAVEHAATLTAPALPVASYPSAALHAGGMFFRGAPQEEMPAVLATTSTHGSDGQRDEAARKLAGNSASSDVGQSAVLGLTSQDGTAKLFRVALKELILKSNDIGDVGAKAIAVALARNQLMQKIDLARNEVGTAGAIALAAALRTCRLTALDLRKNEVGDGGAAALASSLDAHGTLTSLNLEANNIGAAGAASLAAALLKNLSMKHLELRWNKKIGTAGAASLAAALLKNRTLQRLDVGGARVGAAGAASLAAALARGTTTLTSLDLGWDQIGDDGAVSLAGALRVNTSLVALYMHDTAVGERGLVALVEALGVNHTLTTLDLGLASATADSSSSAAVLQTIEGYLARNKAAAREAAKQPRLPPPPQTEQLPELLPATRGSHASQVAHRRLQRSRHNVA